MDVKTDDLELALFLASTMKKEEVEALGLDEVVHTRLHKQGAAPGITSREILSRGPSCPSKWRPPIRPPNEDERRKMLGIMLETSINICMANHFYLLGGEVKKQVSGAGTGLRLSEALGRAYGLNWDKKLMQKLSNLGWIPDMIKRYVDDLNAILKVQQPGTRYNIEEEKLEVVRDLVGEDEEKEADEVTMRIFGEIANSIDPAIQVEIDFPSKKADKMMPILDMQMAMDDNNLVKYKFYRKPQSNKYTMMARSALSNKTKRSTLTDMAMTRLLCCSPNLERRGVVEVMEDFAKMMKRSGYSEKFRHEIISDAVKGHEKRIQQEKDGGRPVDRPREYQERERRKRKEEKRERFYRKEQRGTKVREAVIIIPPTPDSILAKKMKTICSEEMKENNIRVTIQERGGRKLGHTLGHSVPGARGILNCQREKCFVCNSGGKEGICRKTGVGYRITCNKCGNEEVAKYEGETGRNLFIRGFEHAHDVAKKAVDKPLWKHILEKHNGVMARPVFSQFKMDATSFFRSAQRRKANEGVRIANLNPETRMNSCNEFRQGTNITMRPVRGVGV